MKRRSLLASLLAVAATLPTFAAEPAPENLQLFLLIGQSNMAGRGTVEPQDEVINPRIFMLTKELQWAPAKDPLHFDKPKIAGVGLGSEFARVIAKTYPEAKIGLIPAAFGGTTLAQWKPGSTLYKDAVARTQEAQKSGQLKGILWHQGEGDSAPANVAAYPQAFAEMIAQFRKDLRAEDVPVIIGELGPFRPNGASDAFNTALPQIATAVSRCAFVTAEDLADRGDKLHFDSPSLRKFGERYAAAYLKLSPAGK